MCLLIFIFHYFLYELIKKRKKQGVLYQTVTGKPFKIHLQTDSKLSFILKGDRKQEYLTPPLLAHVKMLVSEVEDGLTVVAQRCSVLLYSLCILVLLMHRGVYPTVLPQDILMNRTSLCQKKKFLCMQPQAGGNAGARMLPYCIFFVITTVCTCC